MLLDQQESKIHHQKPCNASHRDSFYQFDSDVKIHPTLCGHFQSDAVVIGGGYAGISAAHAFIKKGLSTLLIEKDYIGSAASGRNGGILLLSHDSTLKESGISIPDEYSLEAMGSELTELILSHGIDAELKRGTIKLAFTKQQGLALKRSLDRNIAPVKACYLERSDLKDFIHSDRYEGGLFEESNFSVNPYKLLCGLAALAEKEGLDIREKSEVSEIRQESAGGFTIITQEGSVTCRRLVVAAGLGLPGLIPQAINKIWDVHSQIGVTESLPASVIKQLLPADLAFSEINTFSRYFRLVANNRLLFGISTVFDPIGAEALIPAIQQQLTDTFPSLSSSRIEFAWSGQIASTREATPWMLRFGNNGILTTNNGVLSSWQGGQIAAMATEPCFAAYHSLIKYEHKSWPPFLLPDKIVRAGGKFFLSILDKF